MIFDRHYVYNITCNEQLYFETTWSNRPWKVGVEVEIITNYFRPNCVSTEQVFLHRQSFHFNLLFNSLFLSMLQTNFHFNEIQIKVSQFLFFIYFDTLLNFLPELLTSWIKNVVFRSLPNHSLLFASLTCKSCKAGSDREYHI